MPEIGDSDILVKIKAFAICGTDLRIFQGGHHGVKPPQILGHEIAGFIGKKGANVKDFKIGNRVTIYPIVSCGYCYYCRKISQIYVLLLKRLQKLLDIIILEDSLNIWLFQIKS
ncbi:MAG TPA: hypothetical protein DCP02_00070 [Actinobacteria bacterium]|nr:hypothetical protein [Actinomycetota bacterium]